MCNYCYNVKEEDAARLSPQGLEHQKYAEDQHLILFGVLVMDRHIPMTDAEFWQKNIKKNW